MALEQETKPIYLSKTFWIQVLGIVAVVLPVTGPFIQEYFMEAGIGWALINMILRLVTKDKIEISVNSFKMILLPTLLIGAASCGLFDKDPSDGGGGSGGGSCDRGVFHQGPYKDPETGKSCNAPGGFCTSDKSCHSSAAKCPCIKKAD